MHGWRITGRWTISGGESRDESFTMLTRTEEPEEVHRVALQALVGLAFAPFPPPTGALTVELTADPEHIGRVVESESSASPLYFAK